MKRILLLGAALSLAATFAPSLAVPTPAVIAGFSYGPPVVVATVAEGAQFTNLDLAIGLHTVTCGTPTQPCSIGTWTTGNNVTVPVGQTRLVKARAAGTYSFFCAVHPGIPTMQGVLVVQ